MVVTHPITHVEGSTEPWVQDILVVLLKALQKESPNVLELGGFLGHTSARLAQAITEIGAGTLTVAEWDAEAPERADAVQARLEPFDVGSVRCHVVRDDALKVIASLPNESLDFAFCDDDHTAAHVREELEALLPKMAPGGLITGHDVFGSCALHEVFAQFGGYSLDFPRLGAAGGLGIIQCR